MEPYFLNKISYASGGISSTATQLQVFMKSTPISTITPAPGLKAYLASTNIIKDFKDPHTLVAVVKDLLIQVQDLKDLLQTTLAARDRKDRPPITQETLALKVHHRTSLAALEVKYPPQCIRPVVVRKVQPTLAALLGAIQVLKDHQDIPALVHRHLTLVAQDRNGHRTLEAHLPVDTQAQTLAHPILDRLITLATKATLQADLAAQGSPVAVKDSLHSQTENTFLPETEPSVSIERH